MGAPVTISASKYSSSISLKRREKMLVNKKVFFVISFMSTMGLFTQDLISQDDESTSRLEEVVVTAQKKEEGLSEVPISIQVIADEELLI